MLNKSENEKKLEQQIKKYHTSMKPILLFRKYNLLRQLSDERGDTESSINWCRRIIREINRETLDTMDIEDVKEASSILRDTHTMLGRDNFHHFLIAMEWNRAKSERFYEPRMKVLKPVVTDLQGLADGRLKVYGLSMPPRTGKSTLGLLFIAWMAGKKPNGSILGAGYSSSLVESFYKGALEFITSDEYRFKDIFPSSPLVDTSAKAMTIDLKNERRYKTITFRSIDGTITGSTEANSLLYLDDLVSGIEEALNFDRLNNLWSKTSVNMLQRMKQGCPMLIIGTRWSIHDPLTRICQRYEGTEGALFRVLPALNEEGESNFDYDYNVGFDTNYYLSMKDSMDAISWECVYMQNPIERDGLLFPEDSLKRYYSLPDKDPDEISITCDCAFGGEDYLSAPIIYTYGEDSYVEDVVFINKADYKVTEPMILEKILSHKVQIGDFESNNGGDFYARDIERMLKEKYPSTKCHITWEKAPTTSSKLSRIIQHSAQIKELYYKDKAVSSTMYNLFMRNLTTFLQNGKSPHDDAPDSLAKFCKRKKCFIRNEIKFIDRSVLNL